MAVVQVRHEFSVINPKNETIATATVERICGVFQLTNVWVHADNRRQGLSTQILNEVIGMFGHEVIYLYIHPYTDRPLSEEQLAAWYERFGFRVTEVPGAMVRPANTGKTGRL